MMQNILHLCKPSKNNPHWNLKMKWSKQQLVKLVEKITTAENLATTESCKIVKFSLATTQTNAN